MAGAGAIYDYGYPRLRYSGLCASVCGGCLPADKPHAVRSYTVRCCDVCDTPAAAESSSSAELSLSPPRLPLLWRMSLGYLGFEMWLVGYGGIW